MQIRSTLLRPAAAGLGYAVIVFGAGFVLGTVRLLILVPHIGGTLAVLLETPLILGVSWWVSKKCVAGLHVSPAAAPRLVMGVVAFMVLMLEEVTLSAALFGRSVTEYLADLTTVPGAIGLAAQAVFAGFPLLQARMDAPDERAQF